MASLNSFDFTGRLGRDPELKSLQSGVDVCNLAVAVDTFGEKPTLWVDVSVWGAGAAPCAKYLSKGSEVAVHGQVDEITSYAKRDGTTGVSLRVSSRDVSFIGGRPDSQEPRSDVPADTEFIPVGAAAGQPDDQDIPF